MLNATTATPARDGRGARRVAGTPGRATLAWWQWPHVVSLDAPVVAVVWQHWWARATGAPLTWVHDLILALGVWMIYLADRLADTRQTPPAAAETTRHAFSARHRRVLRPLLGGVAGVLVLGTPAMLPGRQLVAGLGLLLVAGGYFWLIHRRGTGRLSGYVPKEAVVGLIFAGGTAFFAGWPGGWGWQLWAGCAAYAALCFGNCALITQWEASARDRREPGSLLNAFGWLDGRLGPACLGLAVVAWVAAALGWTVFWPIAVAALALAWLDYQRSAFSPEALRVLADVVLLAPLFCMGR